ncbi:ATP-dependent RecD-like DNA helicase, partial [Klebsiella pneumoniae]|nr:ATP-dependent RecD-like DNA helicase [Klebsiella pneumoniae]
VLQLVNRPNDQVFNGDMGIIQTIDDGVVTVDYQGNSVEYQRKDLIEITLAYACSIHKSQGSEFPIVIMPVVKGYYRMLQKSILYTGITRAK